MIYLDLKDKRLNVVKENLEKRNFLCENLDFSRDFKKGDYIIVSPAFKWKEEILKNLPKGLNIFGGKVERDSKVFLENQKYIDLMEDGEFVVENAKLTAEGFLASLIENTPQSIYEQNILVLGSGRVAKAVWGVLYKLNAKFSTCMRREDERVKAKIFSEKSFNFDNLKEVIGSFDIVINTVPSFLFDEDFSFKNGTLYFELSSVESAKNKNIIFIPCPALPAKYKWKSAGKLVFEKVFSYLKGEK